MPDFCAVLTEHAVFSHYQREKEWVMVDKSQAQQLEKEAAALLDQVSLTKHSKQWCLSMQSLVS